MCSLDPRVVLTRIVRASVIALALALAITIVSPAIKVHAGGGPYQPVLQIVPPLGGTSRPQAFLDACFNMSSWPFVLANAAYLGTNGDIDSFVDDGTLMNCFNQMGARNLRLTVEIGAVKPGCDDGGNCWTNNAFHVTHLQSDLGAPLAFLRMDEPPRAVMDFEWFGANQGNRSYAVTKTADWIQLARANFPGVGIVDVEPYPDLSASRLTSWISALRNECAARGIACPDVFELDHDILDSRGSASEIRDVLVPAAHNAGQAFSIIYTNTSATANSSDNCTFGQAVEFRASSYNLVTDWFTVESWDPNPTVTVPEAQGGCTFMSAAKLLLDLDYYPSKTAVFFDNVLFGGDGFGATYGDMSFVGWDWNDRISSLRVPSGVSVTLYGDIDFGGDSITFTGPANIGDLRNYPGPGADGTWNDAVSSVRVF
jgi:hypothetical protein